MPHLDEVDVLVVQPHKLCVVPDGELVPTDAELPRLIGRKSLIDSLRTDSHPVVLVSGDAGVGKSQVLVAAAAEQAEGIAPVVELRSQPAALQRALLESLADLVTASIDQETILAKVEGIVRRTATKVAQTELKEWVNATGSHLLGVIRARVSPELADAIATAAFSLSTTPSNDLLSRITDASDPDVIDVIAALVKETCDLIGAEHVVFHLDNAERLMDPDLQRLKDLCEHPRERLRICTAFATVDQGGLDQISRLIASGAGEHPVAPLDEHHIALWLSREGLDPGWAADVRKATDGYPLYVSSAVEFLRETGDLTALSDLQPDEVLRAHTERVWRNLDASSQLVAAQLAVFREPLDDQEAAELLGMEELAWITLRRRLTDCFVFTRQPRWFHELRRQVIWESILDDPARERAKERAIAFRRSQLGEEAPPPGVFIDYVHLLSISASELAAHPQLSEVFKCSPVELAVLGSAIELHPPSPQAMSADHVLSYARQVYGISEGLGEALAGLGYKGLLATSSNEYVTAVVLSISSEDAFRAAQGSVAAKCARFPMPMIATNVFDTEIAPRAEGFVMASYGIGMPSIATLSGHGVSLQGQGPGGTLVFGAKGPNLLLRLRLGAVPLYVTLAFDDTAGRDAALANLSELNLRFLGQELHTVDAVAHPVPAIPSQRFLRAAASIQGNPLGEPRRSTSYRSEPNGLTVGATVSLRAQVRDLVRERSNETERFATQLEQVSGFVFAEQGTQSMVAEILGDPAVVQLEAADFPTYGPLMRLQLALAANIDRDATIGRVTVGSRNSFRDPVVEELQTLAERARAFNKSQEPVVLEISDAGLSLLLTDTLQQLDADATALRELVAAADASILDRELAGVELRLLVLTPAPGAVFPESLPLVQYRAREVPIGESSARVRVEVNENLGGGLGQLERAFPISEGKIEFGGIGDATAVLSRLLGYHQDELRLRT